MSATVERRLEFASKLRELLAAGGIEASIDGNYALIEAHTDATNQSQTNQVFSEKWSKYGQSAEREKLYEMQRRWYLSLYGFGTEEAFGDFLRGRRFIFDAGCGLGYKGAWFAGLSPDSLVMGMDFSAAARQAATVYQTLPNLFFMQGDIAHAPFADGSIDYVSCDQVIMHTEDPDATFAELARIIARGGQFACYFYAQKALPRELLDEHFRRRCREMSPEELWQMSSELTELGKRLSELQVSVDVPAIPSLGIKAGRYDLQRFIYWNFLKCFWSAELGRETSIITNFDWYSPSNARRYSEQQVRELIGRHGLEIVYFHQEEACYSGRFAKR